MKDILLSLDDADHAALKFVAQNDGISMVLLLRDIVSKFLATRTVDIEAAQRLVQQETRGTGLKPPKKEPAPKKPKKRFVTEKEKGDARPRMNRKQKEFAFPYGMWTCADGSEVLFNRKYYPIFRRASPRATAEIVEGWYLVPYVKEQWFWEKDTKAPWNSRETSRICGEVLEGWGAFFRTDARHYDMEARRGVIPLLARKSLVEKLSDDEFRRRQKELLGA